MIISQQCFEDVEYIFLHPPPLPSNIRSSSLTIIRCGKIFLTRKELNSPIIRCKAGKKGKYSRICRKLCWIKYVKVCFHTVMSKYSPKIGLIRRKMLRIVETLPILSFPLLLRKNYTCISNENGENEVASSNQFSLHPPCRYYWPAVDASNWTAGTATTVIRSSITGTRSRRKYRLSRW